MLDVEYCEGSFDLLDEIAPLWEKLRDHHAGVSLHFSDVIAAATFTARKEKLAELAEEGALRVVLARLKDTETCIGYCVASVSRDKVGSVESVFVEEPCRDHGIGDALIRKALAWLDGMKVKANTIHVAYGNERVHAFYRRYGFYPRNVLMQQKEKK